MAVWTSAVGVNVAGNDLTKTAAPGWNAGAISTATIAGDGAVEFTTGEANLAKMAGLSHGDGGQTYQDLDFALSLSSTGKVQVYEQGVLRGTFDTGVVDLDPLAGATASALVLHGNSALVDASGLASHTTMATLRVEDNPNLTALSTSQVTVTGNVTVTNNPGLTSLSFPALGQVTGPGFSVVIDANAALQSISFPVLTSVFRRFEIIQNPVLTSVSAPALIDIVPLPSSGDAKLKITLNAQLPICQATAIRDQLLANGWIGTVNVSGVPCP